MVIKQENVRFTSNEDVEKMEKTVNKVLDVFEDGDDVYFVLSVLSNSIGKAIAYAASSEDEFKHIVKAHIDGIKMLTEMMLLNEQCDFQQ